MSNGIFWHPVTFNWCTKQTNKTSKNPKQRELQSQKHKITTKKELVLRSVFIFLNFTARTKVWTPCQWLHRKVYSFFFFTATLPLFTHTKKSNFLSYLPVITQSYLPVITQSILGEESALLFSYSVNIWKYIVKHTEISLQDVTWFSTHTKKN